MVRNLRTFPADSQTPAEVQPCAQAFPRRAVSWLITLCAQLCINRERKKEAVESRKEQVMKVENALDPVGNPLTTAAARYSEDADPDLPSR